jgi:hypothetical protein
MADNTYWDSFDCQIQCEEVYTEDPSLDPANFETESDETKKT